MTRLPPLRALQAFDAAVRCGGITAAAQELNVTAGAVSQQIHNLETALGTRLFERHGRALRLTKWGRFYHDRIQAAFDQLRTAQDDLQHARSKSGMVVSALPSLAMGWLRPLLFDWRKDHAGAGIYLISTDEETDLAAGQVDFRISYGDNDRHYGHYTTLFTDCVVPACAPDFLKLHPVASARDLLAGPLINIEWNIPHLPPPSWGDWARHVGAPSPEGRDLAFSLSSAGIDAAVNGGGFVLGQLAMIADDLAHGRLVIPIDVRLSMPASYFLAWDPAALDRPLGPEFQAFVIAAARRQAASSRTD